MHVSKREHLEVVYKILTYLLGNLGTDLLFNKGE